MIIELEMLHKKLLGLPDFPAELKTLVEHLIISHHGQYEFGSPKLPMFPEALLLHYMDDLDSKIESMRAHFEREIGSEAEWAGYNPSLGRPLLNTQKYLAKIGQPKAQAAAAAASSDAKEQPQAQSRKEAE
jgi:3'-5' exoribonuclease